MKVPHVARAAITLGIAAALAQAPSPARASDDYTLGPDSQPQAGVPRGRVIGPLPLESKVFPNTARQYWVYVPARYDGSRPAAVMLWRDFPLEVGAPGQSQ